MVRSSRHEEAKSQVIEELEQVIDMNRRRQGAEVDEDSVVLEEQEVDEEQGKAPLRSQGYVDEAALNRERDGGFRCCKVTYDVMRSVPVLTLIWAACVVFSSYQAHYRVVKAAEGINLFDSGFSYILQALNWGVLYMYLQASLIAALAILFTGATLELFVGRFCLTRGCAGCFKRFSFKTFQSVFFPATYVGFLATLAFFVFMISTVVAVVMTDMSCSYTKQGKPGNAAKVLSQQVNNILYWLHLPKNVNIPPEQLNAYCSKPHGMSATSWQCIFIYTVALVVSQVNLAISAWTIYLNTGFQLSKGDMMRKHSDAMEDYRTQVALSSKHTSGRYDNKRDSRRNSRGKHASGRYDEHKEAAMTA